jgi:uncharacterized caspase-like protein/uncharacterized protein
LTAARYGFLLALLAAFLALPALAGNRVALVVGNGDYIGQQQLPNPPHDADDVAGALSGLGFKVIEGTNLDKAGFDAKLHEFSRNTTGADVALFYYSGHGMQIDGVNYLVPVDAPTSREDLEFQTVTLDFVQKLLERAKTKVIMLDACRNNPFAAALGQSLGTRAVNANSGLAMTTAPELGYFIAFATQPGHVASDGGGRNSPFTSALKSHITTPGLSVSDLMILVRNDVAAATGGQQIPWDHSALAERFYFKDGESPVANVADTSAESSEAAEAWGWVRDTSNPESLKQFIKTFPDSPLVAQAKTRLVSLQGEAKPAAGKGKDVATTGSAAPAAAPDWTPVTLAANQPVGPSKPSFDCRVRHTDAEVTICNNPVLSLLDNRLNQLYVLALKSMSDAQRKDLVASQRQWVAGVLSCATDAACLIGKYQQQIQLIQKQAAGAGHALTTAALPAPQVKPSFDCATPRSPAEVAVCNNPELAQLDQEMGKLYAHKLDTANPIVRQLLLHAQRHWLRNRDTCASSVACLKIQYQAAVEHLRR